jgi:exodeoxyribonuclease-3
MKIISWNVAGINACCKKGMINFMKDENAEVYCFQEVKANKENFPQELISLSGYQSFHSCAKKKGYSGVSIYTQTKPLKAIEGLNVNQFDDGGRVLTLEFDKFYLINAYFPHSNRKLTRLDFKLAFNKQFLNFCRQLEKDKPIIIASDFNVAHKEIDLKNPKQNKNNAGFTIQERNWFDSFLEQGFIDTFREFNKEPGNYTWWTYRNNARERNIGWRIDYFVISKKLKQSLKKSIILKDIRGSDHCPISLDIF